MPAVPKTRRPLTTQTFPAESLEGLKQRGFEVTTVSSSPERIRVLKNSVAALFEKQPDGALRLAQPPGYVLRGEIGRLWDAGYQKFWLLGPVTDEPFNEPRRPALAEQLEQLKHFSEELRFVLGIPSFFNEAIGSTNEVTAYDRAVGRGSATRQRFSSGHD
jgi:hypothetical protein